MPIKPGDGKRAIAPCGHPGEVIIGQFVQCLRGCETSADDTPSIEHCLRCFSENIDEDYRIDPVYYMWNPGTAQFNRRCWSCGHVWIV